MARTLIPSNVSLQTVDFTKIYFQVGHLEQCLSFSSHFSSLLSWLVITCNCFSSRMPFTTYSDHSSLNLYSSTPFLLGPHRALWPFLGFAFFFFKWKSGAICLILLWLSFFKLSALVASLLGVAGENPTVVLVRNVGFLALAAASGELSRLFFFFLTCVCNLNDHLLVFYSIYLLSVILITMLFLPAF